MNNCWWKTPGWQWGEALVDVWKHFFDCNIKNPIFKALFYLLSTVRVPERVWYLRVWPDCCQVAHIRLRRWSYDAHAHMQANRRRMLSTVHRTAMPSLPITNAPPSLYSPTLCARAQTTQWLCGGAIPTAFCRPAIPSIWQERVADGQRSHDEEVGRLEICRMEVGHGWGRSSMPEVTQEGSRGRDSSSMCSQTRQQSYFLCFDVWSSEGASFYRQNNERCSGSPQGIKLSVGAISHKLDQNLSKEDIIQ